MYNRSNEKVFLFSFFFFLSFSSFCPKREIVTCWISVAITQYPSRYDPEHEHDLEDVEACIPSIEIKTHFVQQNIHSCCSGGTQGLYSLQSSFKRSLLQLDLSFPSDLNFFQLFLSFFLQSFSSISLVFFFNFFFIDFFFIDFFFFIIINFYFFYCDFLCRD